MIVVEQERDAAHAVVKDRSERAARAWSATFWAMRVLSTDLNGGTAEDKPGSGHTGEAVPAARGGRAEEGGEEGEGGRGRRAEGFITIIVIQCPVPNSRE